jgi:hypothetical protein
MPPRRPRPRRATAQPPRAPLERLPESKQNEKKRKRQRSAGGARALRATHRARLAGGARRRRAAAESRRTKQRSVLRREGATDPEGRRRAAPRARRASRPSRAQEPRERVHATSLSRRRRFETRR